MFSQNGPRFLMVAIIGFSNSLIKLSAAVAVVSKKDMPNQ
jgi:hypothetical protein